MAKYANQTWWGEKTNPHTNEKRWSTVYNVAGVKLKRRGVISFLFSCVVEKPINKSRFNKQKVQGEAESLARSRTGNNNNKLIGWWFLIIPSIFFWGGNDEKTDKMRRVRGRALLSTGQQEKKSFVGSARTHPLHTQQHGLQRRFNY